MMFLWCLICLVWLARGAPSNLADIDSALAAVAPDKGGAASSREALAKSMMKKLVQDQRRALEAKERGGIASVVRQDVLTAEKFKQLQTEHDVVVVLFSRGDVPLNLEEFKTNAEKVMQRRSRDKKATTEFAAASVALLDKAGEDSGVAWLELAISTPLGKSLASEYGVVASDAPVVVVVDTRDGDAIAKEDEDENTAATGAKVDSAASPSAPSHYVRYDNKMEADDLVQFVTRFQLAVDTLVDEEALYKFIWELGDDAAAVGVFESRESVEYELFKEAARQLRGKLLLAELVTSEELVKVRRLNGKPVVGVFRNFGQPLLYRFEDMELDAEESSSSSSTADGEMMTVNVASSSAVDKLVGLINANCVDLVDKVDKMTFNVFVQQGLPLMVLWLDPADNVKAEGEWLSKNDQLLTLLRQVAVAMRGKIKFLYADGVENRLQMVKFGASGETLPAATLLDMSKFVHFVHDENTTITHSSLQDMCAGYLDGSLQPNIRKEAPPSEEAFAAQKVKQLVYDTFNSFVMDKAHNVMVAFCVPDDRNCDMLLKEGGILEKVVDALNQESTGKEKYSVAHINLRANDTPRHSIHSVIYGYPTIKFFSAGDKKAVKFESPTINVKALVEFAKAQAAEGRKPKGNKARPSLAEFRNKLGSLGKTSNI